MPLVPRLAAASFLVWCTAATAQDLNVVAELPTAGAPAAGSFLVRRLAPGGPRYVLAFTGQAVRVWRAGVAGEPLVTPLDGGARGAAFPVLEDFDGDGLVDLAFVGTNSIGFLRGDGRGGFVPAATLATSEQQTALASADFDGDGRADLASVRAFGGDVLSCFLSTGGFTFAAPRTTSVTSFGGASSLSAGDVDGDGRPDLVVSPGKGGVTIWRGVGDGTFALSDQSLAGYYPGRVLLADLDGDGRPELVYANVYSQIYLISIEVYRNDGGGRFRLWAEPQMTRSASGPFLADFDGDGLPDVGLVDFDPATGETHLAFFRANLGRLEENRVSLPAESRAVAAGDWDGDGRAELFLSNAAGVRVLGRAGVRTDVSVVPVLLATTGLLGSRFDSDLLLTNSGTAAAHLVLRYVSSAGGGSGAVERDLAPGRQLYAPSAVGFLRDAGLAIAAEGNVVGTLRVEVTGASSPRAVSASVRTTTPAGAGVGYAGVPDVALLRGPAVIPWLAETAKDRTNLALVNAGSAADGAVTLRVEVHAADPALAPAVLPDVVLEPGAFAQIGRVLGAAGLPATTGWARITRARGNAPYLAWASVNDAGSGDGSFEPAVSEDASFGGPWIVPSAVRTGRYTTEFVATNPGTDPVRLQVTLVTTGTVFEESLAPGATFYVPDFFAEVRRRGLPGAPAADADFASPLYLKDPAGSGRVYAGIRVTSTPAAGRSFGVFEAARPQEALVTLSAVVPDLRQDARTRTNLGLVNFYPAPRTFHLEIVDGESGGLAAATDLRLDGNEFRQINAVLTAMAPGVTRAFARVTAVREPGGFAALPLVAYAVVNDGPAPGLGTDDGSFVPAIPE